MITAISNQVRVCATCDRWGGPREAIMPYPSIIVSFDVYSQGKCMGGGFNYQEIGCNATCGQWIKWGVLR